MTDPTADEQQRRGYQEQTAWLQGKSIPEAQQALTEREATLGDDPYNEGGTRATRDYITRMCEAAGVRHIMISHTRAEGTLVHGSVKGDGVYQILHALHGHWRPFHTLGCLGLVQSRDKMAKRRLIEQATAALITAGHVVTVSIDDTEARPVAEVEADRAERAADRAEGLAAAAERRGAAADAAYQRAHQMADAIPFGQPMMPDHYSYGRDRRYRDRIHTTFGRAFAGMDEAKELARRAGAAEANQAHRESIPATLRRIGKLEAELRGVERGIAGRVDYVPDGEGGHKLGVVKPGPRRLAQLEASKTDLVEQLTYWREHVAKAEADGVKVWGPADFTKGDFVRTRYGWAEVLRVNAKSVSIPWNVNHRGDVIRRTDEHYPRPWPYDEVRGRKTAEEMAEFLAEVERLAAAEAEAATAGE